MGYIRGRCYFPQKNDSRITSERNNAMQAKKPRGSIILNEKGGEKVLSMKAAPDQREFFRKKAERLNVRKIDEISKRP